MKLSHVAEQVVRGQESQYGGKASGPELTHRRSEAFAVRVARLTRRGSPQLGRLSPACGAPAEPRDGASRSRASSTRRAVSVSPVTVQWISSVAAARSTAGQRLGRQLDGRHVERHFALRAVLTAEELLTMGLAVLVLDDARAALARTGPVTSRTMPWPGSMRASRTAMSGRASRMADVNTAAAGESRSPGRSSAVRRSCSCTHVSVICARSWSPKVVCSPKNPAISVSRVRSRAPELGHPVLVEVGELGDDAAAGPTACEPRPPRRRCGRTGPGRSRGSGVERLARQRREGLLRRHDLDEVVLDGPSGVLGRLVEVLLVAGPAQVDDGLDHLLEGVEQAAKVVRCGRVQRHAPRVLTLEPCPRPPVTSPLSGPWVPGPWRSSCSPGLGASVLAASLSGAVAPRRVPSVTRARSCAGRCRSSDSCTTSRRRSRWAPSCWRPPWSRGRPDRASAGLEEPRRAAAFQVATASAFVWAIAGVVVVLLTFADASALSLDHPLFAAQLLGSVWAIDTLRIGLISAMAAFVVASGAAVARARSVAVALSVVALFGIAVLGLAGHAGGSADHETAVNAMAGAPRWRRAVDRGTARPHRPAAPARRRPSGGRPPLLHGRPCGRSSRWAPRECWPPPPGSRGSRT